jgi:LysM repeat protein
MPQITLGLPAIIALLALFLTIGAGLVYFALQETGQIPSQGAAAAVASATVTETTTPTPLVSPTPETPTVTLTPEASMTPLSYVVQSNDVCSSIAAAFQVSVQSIVLQNNLPATCDTIYPGQTLLIPQPTPTPTELPTATISAGEATKQACGEVEYVPQANDTLGTIAANYAISITALKEYNGLVSDTIREGVPIKIPLCEREGTPGPTPTATLPPPYAAPNLLLPADGEYFTLADESVTLQWAAVGTLRENEAYAITIKDATAGQEPFVDYVTDTKYIVPSTLRPSDDRVHSFRWWVLAVRQTGTDDDGNPIWEPAGASSEQRVYTWAGVAEAVTPTP